MRSLVSDKFERREMAVRDFRAAAVKPADSTKFDGLPMTLQGGRRS